MAPNTNPSSAAGARTGTRQEPPPRPAFANAEQRAVIDRCNVIIYEKLVLLKQLAEIEIATDTHRSSKKSLSDAHAMLADPTKFLAIPLYCQDRIIHVMQLRQVLSDMVKEGKHHLRHKERQDFVGIQEAFDYCWKQAKESLSGIYVCGTQDWKAAKAEEVLKSIFGKEYMS
ncbi:hypothetical protein K491DRAFT_711190 [Lophiostoma macrostomum CBS 122681]|uniref:Uncharacterized protein n=1 Tax=Lophiostoma macrostomum CBS 122681 TaxID=1314788 RepID=A0A6A6TN97_9PLEO|nr:hypothetical protein K491DRAFT_711190 [Lophiostoma macrostomum CBS 122681]